jgi:hypothetical protein
MQAMRYLKEAFNSAFSRTSPVRSIFSRCIAASSTILVLTIVGQVVLHIALLQTTSDTQVITIAQRQSLLAQRMSSDALSLQVNAGQTISEQNNLVDLRATVALWQRSQQGLLHGDATLGLSGNNSTEVQQLFSRIEPNYEAMCDAAQSLLTQAIQEQQQTAAAAKPVSNLLPFIQTILTNEPDYLTGMNLIGVQYQQERDSHLALLQQSEYLLSGFLLLCLMVDGFLVIFPTLHRMRQTIDDLTEANERVAKAELTRKKVERILALNEALAARQRTIPPVSIVAFGHYQVRDGGENYCNVYYREVQGQQVFECECPQYRQLVICSHSLAAAAMHNASGFQLH